MTSYYNEYDGLKAEWLRELIRRDLIAKAIGECSDSERERIRALGHGEIECTPGEMQGVSQERKRLRDDAGQHGPLNGFWSDAIWLPCSDGKYRPTQPGLFPLAHGAPTRVGRLRGYGDAIVAQQAQAFITAFSEVLIPD